MISRIAATLFALSLASGSAAALNPSPASLDFGGQSMQTTAPALALTIANGGGGPVTVASISVSAPFAVSHDCATVAPGASCTANVTFTPALQGAAAGTLTIESSEGALAVPVAGTGELSLATHYYRSILNRVPDAGGKAYWEADAARLAPLGADVKETWFAMAMQFFASPEYAAFQRDDAGFVLDLYRTFFNRAPDAAGFAYWAGLLSSGMPREVVLASFMFSPEFDGFTQGIFGTSASRAEIDVVLDFYRGLLSRLPDSTGLAYWVQRFRVAQCQGAAAVNTQIESISSAFAMSQEYLYRSRTDAQYVGDLYNSFLRRSGDLTGVQFWISEISSGTRTREQVRRNFIVQPEFQARVAAIIAEGCVSTAPGTFSFAEATAVGAPNESAQVSIRRTGGAAGAFDLLYSLQGSGCAAWGTFGPVRFGDDDAVTKTIQVPMGTSGVCTAIMNPPAAPAGFGPHVGATVTVVPVVAGCPRPSNVVSAALADGFGHPILQRQLSGQTVFMQSPAPSPGRTSGQITFTESAGGAYTPQPVTLEISISRCPGVIDTDYSNFCNLRSTNGNYNSITYLAAAGLFTRDTANQRGYCWAGDGGQYYVNARWTYSSCAFGASVCGFAIQYNDGPF